MHIVKYPRLIASFLQAKKTIESICSSFIYISSLPLLREYDLYIASHISVITIQSLTRISIS